jgi:hypothetical protein
MDPANFPLTTRAGLSPQAQLYIDAFEYDRMCLCLKRGYAPDEGQKRRRAELEAKMKHHARLAAELAARQKEDRQAKEGGNGQARRRARRKEEGRDAAPGAGDTTAPT